ncbi:MAG TPA: DUF1134 domain-containing protein [Nevskiaceae bacterium]
MPPISASGQFSRRLPVYLAAVAFGAALLLAGCASPGAGEAPPAPPAAGGAPQAGAGGQGAPIPAENAPVPNKTYTANDTIIAANNFFGGTTQGLALAVQKVFSKLGEPNAYITGNEGGGAFIGGLRYGIGTLHYKGGQPMRIYWQGPSVGFDFGGNASKVFMLIYNLHWTDQLFQRYPGVAGSLYVIAGLGVNYLRTDDVTIAPIRTGVGLRAGANVGYLKFDRTRTINPF